MSIAYLTSLAFYSQPGASSEPSQETLDEFGELLARTYHALIRTRLENSDLGPNALAYVSALAAMTSARTPLTQVREACRFFEHVHPEVPEDVLIAAAASRSFAPASARKVATKAKSAGRKRSTSSGKRTASTKHPTKRKRKA